MTSVLPPGTEKLSPKTPAIDFTTPLDTSNFKDKSVLITGGASGIGLASVRTIAAAGAFVTIADLQQEAGSAVAKDLNLEGHKVQFIQTDVIDYESQVAAFKKAVEFGGGKIDVVVASAGIIAEKNLFDMVAGTEASINAPPAPAFSGVEVNLKGVYYTSFLALHYFRLPAPADATPFKKALVLIASSAGYVGYPNSTTYSISKFGVRGILYGIRAKAAQQIPEVRVNLIAPWFIKTAMTDVADVAPITHIYGVAPIENVVDAIVRVSINEDISGRAALIMPDGNADLQDDLWGEFGGMVMQQQMGGVLPKIMKSLAESQAAQSKSE